MGCWADGDSLASVAHALDQHVHAPHRVDSADSSPQSRSESRPYDLPAAPAMAGDKVLR